MRVKKKCPRKNLYLFRANLMLTQDEMAERIGCIRCTYAAIENGTRNGRDFFWESLQKAFNIPDADMWELKKKEDQ